MGTFRTAVTPLLEIQYLESGPADGPVAVLLHGFPYDVRSYQEVASLLAHSGVRVIVPFLRGYGGTRFRCDDTLRSGQQAALSQDLLDLMDALAIERATVAGYDWGGRAACIVAATHPDRVSGLVTVGGYNIQSIASSGEPAPPAEEYALWYTHYFLTERGREGLERYRDEFVELIWTLWSPEWRDAAAAAGRSLPSFHNPDFVDVVIHSYRHRRMAAAGDPGYDALEALLATQPPISVPTISIDALADGLGPDDSSVDREHFTGPFEIRRFEHVGHNPPQESPAAFADAVLSLTRGL